MCVMKISPNPNVLSYHIAVNMLSGGADYICILLLQMPFSHIILFNGNTPKENYTTLIFVNLSCIISSFSII